MSLRDVSQQHINTSSIQTDSRAAACFAANFLKTCPPHYKACFVLCIIFTYVLYFVVFFRCIVFNEYLISSFFISSHLSLKAMSGYNSPTNRVCWRTSFAMLSWPRSGLYVTGLRRWTFSTNYMPLKQTICSSRGLARPVLDRDLLPSLARSCLEIPVRLYCSTSA